LLGHPFVPRISISHMYTFYVNRGASGPYTAIVSPGAFNTTTGNELPPGTNAPSRPFAASTSGPHELEGLGLTGPMHISVSGFTLNVGSVVDLFFSSLMEKHINRNGNVANFEETALGVFNQVASWSIAIFDIDIDYSDGSITNTFTGTLYPGSLGFFSEDMDRDFV
jgi:hypothetical protein